MAKKKSGKRKASDAPVLPNRSDQHPSESVMWWREAVESLVIAIVLALLIRAYEAEAFVIPTGSMAPTLQGQHKDVKCQRCGYRYRSGASEDNEGGRGAVVSTICPMCSYPMDLNEEGFDPNHVSFTGDRILVNKFAYDFGGEPQRWDVIVFKYPGNAKQNYIKRLIGLPGETIRIHRGDIYVRSGDRDFEIARKPPRKLRRLLQLVHDTQHIPAVLDEAGFQPRWQADPADSAWTTSDTGRTFSLQPSTDDGKHWIRYRHIKPSPTDWSELDDQLGPEGFGRRRGQLITDFYAYNASFHSHDSLYFHENRSSGKNWVGDLALECDVRVENDSGEILLDLVEGGWHFQCTMDVATGEAKLSINDGSESFTGERETVLGRSKLQGAGSYRVLFSNVDNELRLWVNNRVVEFDGPTTYERDGDFRPTWTASDPGDLAPAGLGGKAVKLDVKRLRVLRDVYYVATSGKNPSVGDYTFQPTDEEIARVFSTPESWATARMFDDLQTAEFELQDFDDDRLDQFFPMGDNSPQSKDARIWESDPWVERQMLTGKAILVYWPHPWHLKIPGVNVSLPLLPNIKRMGIIR